LGRLLAEGRTELLEVLRRLASDPRWRVREGVAIALQKFGDADMAGLLRAMLIYRQNQCWYLFKLYGRSRKEQAVSLWNCRLYNECLLDTSLHYFVIGIILGKIKTENTCIWMGFKKSDIFLSGRKLMERYTRKNAMGIYEITDLAKAAEALGKYEDLYDYLMECEQTIPAELEKLRREGKEKSYKFRETMSRKLLNVAFISLLNRFGIN
jgi:hypothetical protein